MARRKRVYNKEVRKDSRYDSELVATLISNIMLDGKKALAERIVYTAIEMLTAVAAGGIPRMRDRRVGGIAFRCRDCRRSHEQCHRDRKGTDTGPSATGSQPGHRIPPEVGISRATTCCCAWVSVNFA